MLRHVIGSDVLDHVLVPGSEGKHIQTHVLLLKYRTLYGGSVKGLLTF